MQFKCVDFFSLKYILKPNKQNHKNKTWSQTWQNQLWLLQIAVTYT